MQILSIPGKEQHWQQWCFFTYVLFFVCLFVCQSVFVHLFTISSFWKLTTIDFLVYICEPCFRARNKNVTAAYVSKCLGIVPKNQGEGLVSGFGSEQCLQQESTPACFIGHVCSIVVLWNVCFLSVQSSLFVSAWLWTTTLHYNYSTLDNISKCFNIWIKCFEIMFQRLEVLICFFAMDMHP